MCWVAVEKVARMQRGSGFVPAGKYAAEQTVREAKEQLGQHLKDTAANDELHKVVARLRLHRAVRIEHGHGR